MQIRQWISGKELMERWGIKPLDLVDIVVYENLPVYEPDGKLIEYEAEYAIRANHPGPYPPPPSKDDPTIYNLIFDPLSYDYKIPPIHPPTDYKPLANKIDQCFFKLNEVEGFEKINKINLTENNNNRKKEDRRNYNLKNKRKNTKNEIAKEKIREKALKLWKKNPIIPIADMVVRNELNEITENICGKIFTEKTLRNWIKDLCPNREPGRRPNKGAG